MSKKEVNGLWYGSRFMWSLGLWVLLVASWPVGASGEAVYRISETELNQLEVISRKLEDLNNSLRQQLESSGQSLQEQERLLTDLKNQLESSKHELSTLSAKLRQAENLSELLSGTVTNLEAKIISLEGSFEQYEQEVQLKIRRLKWQRNISWFVAVLLGFN